MCRLAKGPRLRGRASRSWVDQQDESEWRKWAQPKAGVAATRQERARLTGEAGWCLPKTDEWKGQDVREVGRDVAWEGKREWWASRV